MANRFPTVIYRPSSGRTRLCPVLFFLIVPAWVFCLLGGFVLLCLQGFRRTGIYVITVSSAGTLVSLVLSSAALYLGPRVGFLQHLGSWSGVVLIGGYLAAVVAGGVVGSLAGFSLTRKLLHR